MKSTEDKKYKKAIDYLTRHSDFVKDDVNLLLRIPFKKDLETLIDEVNLTERERIIVQYYFIDNKNVGDTAERLGLSEKQIDREVSTIKDKCYDVWQHDINAKRILLSIKIQYIKDTLIIE